MKLPEGESTSKGVHPLMYEPLTASVLLVLKWIPMKRVNLRSLPDLIHYGLKIALILWLAVSVSILTVWV